MDKAARLHMLLSDLRAQRIARHELYSAIHEFGNEGFLEAKSDVEALLTDPDPELRYIALNVLTFHWMCPEHRRTCETFARHDPHSDNRRMGVAGLGALLEGTQDRLALELLLQVFRDDSEEWDVRDAAYRSILYVLGAPVSEQPAATRKLDYGKDLNLDRIKQAERIVKANPLSN